MSMETTLARAWARAAETAWKGHYGHCPRCVRAVRSRAWGDLCWDGAELRGDHLDAAKALTVSRELDKQSAPSQKTLF